MPHVSRLLVHPVKSLDPHPVDAVDINNGALRHDREYAIVDGNREFVNGKREPAIHRIRSEYDHETRTLRVREQGDDEWESFRMDADRGELNAWLSGVFDYPVSVVRDASGGMPDDTTADGPTVIAWETVAAVADWFDDIGPEEMLRRLRPNVVVEAGEAFWEDRLYADRESVREFTIGDVEVRGHNPCQRCVVPSRDPDTGEETDGFRERFVTKREETLPAWAAHDWFDHHFRVMVNTSIPESEWGKVVAVGDEVELGDERSV
ncbi:MOSC domain-containing protein [Haloarchaeobius amylolyticus]|uniref:MOSC domain-containing protein n=1 Tax=Haloarchaeobius amylolyticus TaxID=1198296 RepID=UPI00226E41BD|nr:MOSC N-terminal beta barrel domain-containing protein [Haloarchaeobius amylolyticus]